MTWITQSSFQASGDLTQLSGSCLSLYFLLCRGRNLHLLSFYKHCKVISVFAKYNTHHNFSTSTTNVPKQWQETTCFRKQSLKKSNLKVKNYSIGSLTLVFAFSKNDVTETLWLVESDESESGRLEEELL